MFRIDDPTALAQAPTDTAPTGDTPGFFTNGNPTIGQPATIVPDWWLNQQQEENMSILAEAGIVPAKGTNNQVLGALLAMFQPMIVFGGKIIKPTSGLILQSFAGPLSAVANAANSPVQWDAAFPEPFPNACVYVVASDGANGCILWNNIISVGQGSVTGWVYSTIAGTNRSGNPTILAIGY